MSPVHFPKITPQRLLYTLAGILLGLAFPVTAYLGRLFIIFRASHTPLELFLHDFNTHFTFYVTITFASTLFMGGIAFYIGAAREWLARQREDLEETHNFYQAKIDEEAERTKKLEAIGLLASGLAHNFNNTLTTILGNLALAKMSIGQKEEIQVRLKAAETAAASAKKLTQQLLAFARIGDPVKKPVPMKECLEKILSEASADSGCRFNISITPDLPSADIDEGQIRQALRHLIANATEALQENGTIEFTARPMFLETQEEIPLPPGPYIVISIVDHGPGIPEDDLPRIFDPYFTTKPKATGLGLTMVHSIVQKHDGYIRVESVENEKTVVTLFFPASGKQQASQPPQAVPDTSIPGRPHCGRILLMDDDAMVCTMVHDVLERFGYSVETAENGESAVELYNQASGAGHPFDCVILDLTVPKGMGGKEAAERILEADPDAPVIVASGYSDDPIMSSYQDLGIHGAIKKPFSIEELRKTVGDLVQQTRDRRRSRVS